MSVELLSAKNPVFTTYAFYSIVLILKMLLMSTLTGFQRFRKKAFISPEDLNFSGGEVKYDDPDVERVRRAHLNDLENIPIFLVTGLLFVLSNPNEFLAEMLFRSYAALRILHTVVYAMFVVRQPARAILFFGGHTINMAMCGMVAIKFFHL